MTSHVVEGLRAAISAVAMSAGGSDRVVVLLDRQIQMAIARRQLIRFKYGSTIRVAEPHDYGIQHGFVRLLVYQRRAMPFSRGWRMLDVSKTGQLELRRDVRGQPPRGARASLPVG
jgi:hypothetical protein